MSARYSETSFDTVHDHALMAVVNLELHGFDAFVCHVSHGTGISKPNPPREFCSVRPVDSVVVVWQTKEPISDSSPVHTLDIIDAQF